MSLSQSQLIDTNNINFPGIKPKEKGLKSDLICSKSAISSVLNCNFYAWTQSLCGIDMQISLTAPFSITARSFTDKHPTKLNRPCQMSRSCCPWSKLIIIELQLQWRLIGAKNWPPDRGDENDQANSKTLPSLILERQFKAYLFTIRNLMQQMYETTYECTSPRKCKKHLSLFIHSN